MAFKLFEKKAAADDVQPSPPETANPASVEPKSEINETAEPVHSDRGDDDKNEEHMFHGVAEMEAITSAWTTKSMLIAYALCENPAARLRALLTSVQHLPQPLGHVDAVHDLHQSAALRDQ